MRAMCAIGQNEQPALATTATVGSVLGGSPTSANPTRALAKTRGSLLAGTVGGGFTGTPGGGGAGGGSPSTPRTNVKQR